MNRKEKQSKGAWNDDFNNSPTAEIAYKALKNISAKY